jgi:hypothetical protein
VVVRLVGNTDAQVTGFFESVASSVAHGGFESTLPAISVLGSASQMAKSIVAAGNRWFIYFPLLHRLREAGTMVALFESLSFRAWNGQEARRLVELIAPDQCRDDLPKEPKEPHMYAMKLQGAAEMPECQRYDPFTGDLRPFADHELMLELLVNHAKGVAERERMEAKQARTAARAETAQRVLVCLMPWRKQED